MIQTSSERSTNNHSLSLVPVPENEQIKKIEYHFKQIMEVLGLDLADENLRQVPLRIANMYVHDLFSGMNPLHEPVFHLIENKTRYHEIVLERDISFFTISENHFFPVTGKAHIAYIPEKKIASSPDIRSALHYFSKRPQMQERLTIETANFLKEKLETEHVAVLINAKYVCTTVGSAADCGSNTITGSYHGRFLGERKEELFSLLKQ